MDPTAEKRTPADQRQQSFVGVVHDEEQRRVDPCVGRIERRLAFHPEYVEEAHIELQLGDRAEPEVVE